MSAGSQKINICYIIALLLSFCLAGCSNSPNSPALVSFINGSSSYRVKSTSSSLLLPPLPQSARIGRITHNAPLVTTATTAIAQTKIQPADEHNNITHLAPVNVKMKNGYIVYNRQYGNIPKGSYTGGSTYTVKYGDTLFYIAWITGNDFRDLAQLNDIQAPYILNVGQTLQLFNVCDLLLTPGNKVAATAETAPPYSSSSTAAVTAPATLPAINSNESRVSSIYSSSSPISVWRWPTGGKIIENFSSSEGGNKGIDIAGSKGQDIAATADGRVVYAGSALRGYGNLIIIKHKNDYLSAYAHNDTMLVREQQKVQAGQKIATMGSTGTNSTRLHFEIRYKGKSVNPLQYLPPQR